MSSIARRALLAAVVTAGLVPGVAAAQAPSFTAKLDGPVQPIGFVGDAVLVIGGDGVQRVNAGGATDVYRETAPKAFVQFAAASQQRLAVLSGPLPAVGATEPTFGPPDGSRIVGFIRSAPAKVLVGTPDGRLAAVAQCPALDAVGVGPAVSGTTVAWRSCPGTGVEVDDGGRRVTLAASGTVIALAVEGRRVAWVAARGTSRSALLQVADLDTGAVRTLEGLRPSDRHRYADVDLAPDGTARVVLVRPGKTTDVNGRCELETALPDAPLGERTPFPGCVPIAPDADPAIMQTPLRGGRSVRLDLVPAPGGAPVPVATAPALAFPRAVVADGRYAATAQTCREVLLATGPVGAPAAVAGAIPSCPLSVLRKRLRADRRGVVRIPVRCPRGCAVRAGDNALFAGQDATTGRLTIGDAGGRGVLRLTLSRSHRRQLRRRPVRGQLTIVAVDQGDHRTRGVRVSGPR